MRLPEKTLSAVRNIPHGIARNWGVSSCPKLLRLGKEFSCFVTDLGILDLEIRVHNASQFILAQDIGLIRRELTMERRTDSTCTICEDHHVQEISIL